MRLSDSAIRERIDRNGKGRIIITPSLKDEAIQPASIDLRLSSSFRIYLPARFRDLPVLDPSKGFETSTFEADVYILEPGEFLLASTLEKIEVPDDLVAVVDGKSTLGRLGLAVHVTAGFIDPGFRGNITLEMRNLNIYPIRLRKDMPICQLGFETLEGKVLRPYGSEGLGSKYQDSAGTVGAKVAKADGDC